MDYSWKLKCEADQDVCEDYKQYMKQIEGIDKQCSSQKDMCDELNSITLKKQKQYLTDILDKNYCDESLIGGEGKFKNMPSDYIYILKQRGFYYCFTFNELKGIIQHDNHPNNPFTRVDFSEDEIRGIRKWLNSREGIFVEIDEKVELTPEQQASNDLDLLFELRHVNYPPNYLEFKDKYRTREEIIKLALQLNNIWVGNENFLFNIRLDAIMPILNPELNPHVQFINVFNPTRVNDYEKAQILSYFLHKSNDMKEYIRNEDRFKNVYYDMYERFFREREHEDVQRWLYWLYDLIGNELKLFEASKKGDLNGVNRLLEEGVDVNGKDGEALILASENGHLEIVNRLIEAGADVNINNGKALISANKNGYLDIVNRLLEAGVDTSNIDLDFGKILISASQDGNLDIVNRLIEAGVNVNTEGNALAWASINRHSNVAEKLLEAGAEVNAQNGQALISVLRQANYFTNLDHLEIVNVLVDAGADVNIRNGEALILAGNNLNILKKLIEAGADVNGRNGEALILASKYGDLEIVNILVEAGADVNVRNGEALTLANENNHLNVAKRLLEAGAEN